jgi:hypothetical protein
MQINPKILGIIVVLWSALVGLAIIAFGQLMLAWRETAINTRKEGSKTASHYEILLIVAKINNLLGWIFMVLGVAIGIYIIVAGAPIKIATEVPATIPM